METGTLEKKIAKLPEELKHQVEGYIDALLDFNYHGKKAIFADSNQKDISKRSPRPVFGSGKGIFGKIADDFDEPLEDMKEYM